MKKWGERIEQGKKFYLELLPEILKVFQKGKECKALIEKRRKSKEEVDIKQGFYNLDDGESNRLFEVLDNLLDSLNKRDKKLNELFPMPDIGKGGYGEKSLALGEREIASAINEFQACLDDLFNCYIFDMLPSEQEAEYRSKMYTSPSCQEIIRMQKKMAEAKGSDKKERKRKLSQDEVSSSEAPAAKLPCT